MKIKFPIACDRDYEIVMAIIAPEIFCINYACLEAKELYYSLTAKEKKEIKEYVEQNKNNNKI